MDEFCSLTAIRGFSFFKNSHSRWEKCFWSILILAFLSITAYDVVSTTEKFLSDSSITNVMIERNSTFDLDDATLCIELNPLLFDYGTKISFDNQLSAWELLSLGFSDSIITTNESLTLWILLISQISNSDATLESLPTKSASTGKNSSLTEESAKLIFKLLEFLRTSNISVVHMIRNVGKRIVDFISLKVKKLDKECDDQLRVTWLGNSPADASDIILFCVRIKERCFHFKSINDKTTIVLNSSVLYKPDTFPNENLDMILEFSAVNVFDQESGNFIFAPQFTRQVVWAQIVGLYRRRSTKLSPCQQSGDWRICALKCKYKSLMNLADCSSFHWLMFASQNSSASFCLGVLAKAFKTPKFDLMTKQINTAYKLAEQNYMDPHTCTDDCEATLMSFRSQAATTTQLHTELSITVDSYSFPSFKEYPAMDFKGYISALGGNLNFYVGASFMALIHVVVYAVRSLTEKTEKP